MHDPTWFANMEREQAERDCLHEAWAHEQELHQQYLAAGLPRHNQEPKMKLNDMMPSKYLKTSDVDGDTVVTVKELKKVNVARDDAEAEYKWTITFQEFPKAMVLNKTNLIRMGKALGDDSDDWIGNQVVLYVDDNVQYGADVVSGLRIRAVKHPANKAKASIDEVNRKLAAAADSDNPF